MSGAGPVTVMFSSSAPTSSVTSSVRNCCVPMRMPALLVRLVALKRGFDLVGARIDGREDVFAALVCLSSDG